MKINLTKNDYRTLLDLLYLGNWILQSHDVDQDPQKAKYLTLEQKFLALAAEFGFGHLVEYDEELKEYFPTKAFEDKSMVMPAIYAYDNDTFWEELGDRLALRDLIRQEGEDRVQAMELKERFEKLAPFLEKYHEEFEQHGLDRISIKD